jgi:hypothetical protein
MGVDRGDVGEIVKPERWTVGRVVVAIEAVMLCLVAAGFIGGLVGGKVGGALGGCTQLWQ